MSSERHKFLACVLAPLAATVTGCWGGDGLAPVEGRVVMDGEPVQGAAVMFIPEEGGRPAWGHTDQSGEFQLTTYQKRDGALIGPHRVAVTKVVEESVSAGPKKFSSDAEELQSELVGRRKTREVWVIPRRYSDATQSGLEFDVASGGENRAVFELTSS